LSKTESAIAFFGIFRLAHFSKTDFSALLSIIFSPLKGKRQNYTTHPTQSQDYGADEILTLHHRGFILNSVDDFNTEARCSHRAAVGSGEHATVGLGEYAALGSGEHATVAVDRRIRLNDKHPPYKSTVYTVVSRVKDSRSSARKKHQAR
jgi:hypothetical protein